MHDLVIRNGTVVDGTGGTRRIVDIAVNGELITAVGGAIGRGRREINADGLLVTPGYVDIHTHYDGQATWDPYLTPSSWHGVTTVVFGNCGVGFAPVRKGAAPYLINLMEGVEDIPGTVLAEGVKFDWESAVSVPSRRFSDSSMPGNCASAGFRFRGFSMRSSYFFPISMPTTRPTAAATATAVQGLSRT